VSNFRNWWQRKPDVLGDMLEASPWVLGLVVVVGIFIETLRH